jgi:hypothetical protein
MFFEMDARTFVLCTGTMSKSRMRRLLVRKNSLDFRAGRKMAVAIRKEFLVSAPPTRAL